jgi:hypothetical protein
MRSQVLYNVGLCLWQLSMDKGGMEQLQESGAVEPLVALLKEGMPPQCSQSALSWNAHAAHTSLECARLPCADFPRGAPGAAFCLKRATAPARVLQQLHVL